MSGRFFNRGNSRGRANSSRSFRPNYGQRPQKRAFPGVGEEPSDTTMSTVANKRVKMDLDPSSIDTFPKMLLSGIPRRGYFPVLVSNRGLDLICEVFYQELISSDPRAQGIIPLWELRYAAHICYIYRCLTVNRMAGVYVDENLSRLKAAVEHIRLPSFIANYIESIGVVELSTGAKVIPRFGNNLTVFGIQGAVTQQRINAGEIHWSNTYRDPRSILLEENRPIVNQPWSVDVAAITQYQEHITRIQFKRQYMMREVNWDKIEGRPSMIVTVRQGELSTGLSPQQLLEGDFKLGVMYRFRIENEQLPPGCEDAQLIPCTFEGVPTERRLELAKLASSQE